DISVQLKMPNVSFFGEEPFRTDRQLFIECKRYRTTLTLDKVGKVFCHSILEQPDALWIVSPRRLSAQASDYARKLFVMGDSKSQQPLLKRTRFRHWRLNDLIGRTVSTHQPSIIEIADWQIIQTTAFGSTLIASASVPRHTGIRRIETHDRTSYHA